MADLNDFFGDFDDSAVQPSQGFDSTPIPNGEYALHIEKQEIVATKDQTGIILKLTMSVVEGEFENRKIWVNLNIRNKSAQAQAIAIGEFKALCLACGVDYEIAKRDTDVLDRIVFRANVGLEKPQEGYAPRNKITKYLPVTSAPAVPVQKAPLPAAAKAAAPRPAAAGKSVPWAKSA
ncbi:DUF669 domain-containing protein [Alsobacter sp. R-9]